MKTDPPQFFLDIVEESDRRIRRRRRRRRSRAPRRRCALTVAKTRSTLFREGRGASRPHRIPQGEGANPLPLCF